MDTRLVGWDVLARLEACAPRVGSSSPEVARMILKLLSFEAESREEEKDMDHNLFWSIDLSDVSDQLPPTISPKIVGSVCRSMGLFLWRKNSGYFLAWNKEQLNILLKYFFMEERVK